MFFEGFTIKITNLVIYTYLPRTGVPNLFVAVSHLWSYSEAAYHLTLTISFVDKTTVHKG